MQDDQLNKPDNLSDAAWKQHLRWMRVMREQVEDNFARHMARVQDDASRCETLLEKHLQVSRGKRRRTRSLFCK
ncbi:MAG: hypothetical protein KDI09_02660 [Halioglobus sp.]|nr:hypothetical protein [Halioglobus sp.]